MALLLCAIAVAGLGAPLWALLGLVVLVPVIGHRHGTQHLARLLDDRGDAVTRV